MSIMNCFFHRKQRWFFFIFTNIITIIYKRTVQIYYVQKNWLCTKELYKSIIYRCICIKEQNKLKMYIFYIAHAWIVHPNIYICPVNSSFLILYLWNTLKCMYRIFVSLSFVQNISFIVIYTLCCSSVDLLLVEFPLSNCLPRFIIFLEKLLLTDFFDT